MPAALAIAAHPDDIEFLMAGTLLQLRAAGWAIHVCNLSSGNLGSMTSTPAQTARMRRREAQAAAKILGAKWHAPIADDLQIFYDDRALRRVCAIVRAVDPQILLTHSPEDYMEDHMNTARLAVAATFARGMPHYRSAPARRAVDSPVAIYHANPHGLRDGMRRRISPGLFVDSTDVHETKRAALACHASQKSWLDATQGMDSYLGAMDVFSTEIGRLSRKFRHAEGWRRHAHLGFGPEAFDPLCAALGAKVKINAAYERSLG